CPPEILLEPESVYGDSPARGEAGEGVAGGAGDGVAGQGISENQRAECRLTDVARQLTTGGGKPGQGYPAVLAHTLRAEGFDASEDGTGRGTPIVAHETGQGWWK